ncbi:MAG: HlyD family efflux transporter periplasmic adaptor subunit [Bacteroidetes bacterium]|nr:HlyD family efflux transporter periplasmic adaptor subunit [Bacteroidota bacterium]
MNRVMKCFFLVAVSFTVVSCGKKTATIHPEYRNLTEAVYASGNLYPAEEYKLFSNVQGTLLKRLVEAGDSVHVGSLLFLLDEKVDLSRLNAAAQAIRLAQLNAGPESPVIHEMEAALASLKEKYQQDSLNYARYQVLYKKDAVNKKSLEQTQLAFEVTKNDYFSKITALSRTKKQLQVELANARANYEMQLQQVDDHAPISRVDGLVYEVLKEEGEAVRPGELLAILGESDKMIIRLQVDELDIRRVHVGQEVIVRFDIDQNQIYKAHITRIYPKLNKVDQSFRVEAKFDESGPTGLYGLTLEGNIIVQKKQHVLCISRDLLLPGDSVRVQSDEGGKKVKIETSAMDWDYVEVTGGLDEDQDLIAR